MSRHNKFTFQNIDAARRLLSLDETVTIAQIKLAYRSLAKKYHPDTTQESKEVSEEMMRKLNDAFQILMEYSLHFPISLRKENVHILDPEEILREQFGDDWLYS